MKNRNQIDITSLTREEMMVIARETVNAHFLTNHDTHDQVMADPTTGPAMIGFMKCWSLCKNKRNA